MRNLLASFVSLSLAVVLAAGSPGARPAEVRRAESPGDFIAYLVDGEGRSLYMSLNDRDGKSFCTERCLQTWTPFTTEGSPVAGDGVDAARIGTIVRDDGTLQVTYAGRPLYIFGDQDESFGTGGHGSGGLWFLVGPDGQRAQATESAVASTVATTSGKGWFTEEQVRRGKQSYEASCAICHHVSLLGEQYAPALKGTPFLRKWGGNSIGELYEYVHGAMPLSAPGSLEPQKYIDIISYILHQNDFPLGGDELPADPAELAELIIDSP